MKELTRQMNHAASMEGSFVNNQVRFFAGWYWCAYYANINQSLDETDAA
jgi:hypothetical protein